MEDAIKRSFGPACPVPIFHDAKAAEEWYKSRRDSANPSMPMTQLYYTLTTWSQVQRVLIPHLHSLGDPQRHSGEASASAASEHATHILHSAAVYARLPWNPDAVLNTLRYMFFHTRCGICVSVRKGKVAAFVPFVNEEYTNQWSDKIVFGDEHGTSVQEYVARKAACTRKCPEAVLPMSRWWMNGGIVCNVMPREVWGDAYLAALRNMLDTTCDRWAVPDVDFFINKRDYPVLKQDGSEPYARFTGDATLRREAYSTYAPIFSFYTGTDTADLPMPTTEDWCAATAQSFPGGPCSAAACADVPFASKKPMAVFRGSATGESGETNARLRLLAAADPTLVDAGITAFNASRDKVVSVAPDKIVVDFRAPGDSDIRAPFMSLADQFATYRYVIYVDGHAAASRYGTLMHSGCVILKTDSLQTRDAGWLWMFAGLQGGVVGKGGAVDIPDAASYMVIYSDYSNLSDTIQYLNTNEEQASRIAGNAKAAAPTVDAITAYWRDVLTAISNVTVQTHGTGGEWYSFADKKYAC